MVQRSDQNVVTTVSTHVLKFNRILTYKHRLYVEILLKPHVLHSSSAFRSGTSAPFLWQSKYLYGRFGVPVGVMDSRGPSEDLARRVG